MAIANNFPTKNKSYSIENSPNWDPRVLLPVNTGKNASFFTWIDPTTNNTVMYIQFRSPITVPYKFFESFATTVSGGVDVAKKLTSLSPQKEHADLDIYYNVNQPNVNITTFTKCKEMTSPYTTALVNFNIEEKKKEQEEKNPEKPKCEKITCKVNIWLLIFIGILLLFMIGFAIYKLKTNKTSKLPKPPSNNIIPLKQITTNSN